MQDATSWWIHERCRTELGAIPSTQSTGMTHQADISDSLFGQKVSQKSFTNTIPTHQNRSRGTTERSKVPSQSSNQDSHKHSFKKDTFKLNGYQVKGILQRNRENSTEALQDEIKTKLRRIQTSQDHKMLPQRVDPRHITIASFKTSNARMPLEDKSLPTSVDEGASE